MARRTHVTTSINGLPTEFLCEPRQSVLEVLRDELGLMGAKEGCNNGNCGACTVLLNGLPVNSCLVLGVEAEGAKIETVESLATQGHLHPLQQCFLEGAALQCGVCTPGFLVAAKALLDKNPSPSEHEIRFQLDFDGELMRITLIDDAMPFNPWVEAPAVHDPQPRDLEELAVGGRGVHMLKQATDSQHYERKDGRNINTVTRSMRRPVTHVAA